MEDTHSHSHTTTIKPHAVIIPLCYQGPITPSKNLALKLASKGFTITFVNTQIIHHQITKSLKNNQSTQVDDDLFAGARNSGLDIRYKTITDGFPLNFDRASNITEFGESKLYTIPAHVDELLSHLVPNDPSFTCLITDTLYTWTSLIARKYNLVNVSFWTEPALVFSLNYYFDLIVKNGHFASNVGPIIPSEFTKSLVPTSLRTESDCNQWLNTKPKRSVLYVSFGSFIPSKKIDIDETAHGLVLSRVNFIWVLRPDAVSNDKEESFVLPIGFEDEIKDKGLIIPWCSQIEVLSNPAVGGFLTHCGWNSILESLWCGGVPLLCYPLMTDHPTNRKIVVDDWRIGVNLCDRKPLTRLEATEKINCLMNGKSAEDLRKETFKVRQTVENASSTEGSSEKNLNQFICDVKAKISKRIC